MFYEIFYEIPLQISIQRWLCYFRIIRVTYKPLGTPRMEINLPRVGSTVKYLFTRQKTLS